MEIQDDLETLDRKAGKGNMVSPSLVSVLGLLILGRHNLALHQYKGLLLKCEVLHLQ